MDLRTVNELIAGSIGGAAQVLGISTLPCLEFTFMESMGLLTCVCSWTAS